MANTLMMKALMTAFVLLSASSQIFANSRWYVVYHIPKNSGTATESQVKEY